MYASGNHFLICMLELVLENLKIYSLYQFEQESTFPLCDFIPEIYTSLSSRLLKRKEKQANFHRPPV